MNKLRPEPGEITTGRSRISLSERKIIKKMTKADTKTMFFVLFVAKNGKMIILSTHPHHASWGPSPALPKGREFLPAVFEAV